MSLPDPPSPLAGPVVDSHTHLDLPGSFPPASEVDDVDVMLARARDAGVVKVVQIGCDVDYARWSVEMAQTRPDVAVGVSVHPNDAARLAARAGLAALDAALDEIAELATDGVVRAVGETGLDYYRTPPELQHFQHHAFRAHIRIAKELGKALVIHDRDAHADVVALLIEEGPPASVVFHCFSGGPALAEICADHGWFTSFAGPITYKANQELREALAVVPEELVLVETDAPYLTPVPHRGKPNGSYLMPYTVRYMAEQRGQEEARMCALLYDNSMRAFGPW